MNTLTWAPDLTYDCKNHTLTFKITTKSLHFMGVKTNFTNIRLQQNFDESCFVCGYKIVYLIIDVISVFLIY